MQNIVATMQSITTGNGYSQTIQSVIRAKLPGVQINEFPTILVVEGTQTTGQPTEDGSPLGKWTNFLNVACIGYTADEDMGEAINELEANIQKAMVVDIQRGGYAVLTNIVSSDPFILEEVGHPMAAIRCIFEINYRFKDRDPFSL